jgi:type I restriction enzyme M protein
MLDDVTKKRINTLRQILVGKLPDPKAQVEQITNGLIYKFMNDMDEESISMGGKSTYFSGKYQKYSWKNLLNTKTSGVEKLSLYSEAIEQMYNNENLPELFREIFKNSFLPFKDPSTLNMFLKEINEFHYSNSEKLGDAFEYLLSFMGSQGDAGQFRTPRHIIDFIVEIINPQKNETILDPACGTAGFLISSYKHILKQNTKKNLGDGLSSSDRKKIGENLNGYDISPDMVKMSLVNMYLHKFTNPKINEYDTLSSENRWNEYYDVILANPPFFSPKGGIMPHNRFGVKSTKAEVLFVDYINEHLKPNGRAGIIVPEGVIFQTGTAYKQLRKRLIETSLIGVISLPAGVFQPYSGVKTSILILDKKLNKQINEVTFLDIKNDGFDLSANRKEIKDNDLPSTIKLFRDLVKNINDKNSVKKEDILSTEHLSFSVNHYFNNNITLSKYDIVKFGSVCKFQGGSQPPKENFIYEPKDGFERFIQIRDFASPEKFLTYIPVSNKNKRCVHDDILIGRYGASVGEICTGLSGAYNVALIKCINNKEKLSNRFLYYYLKSKIIQDKIISLSARAAQAGVNPKHLEEFDLPLPSIDQQNHIVEELDGYQKIIDGSKQVIENYKPSIDIDPSWEKNKLQDVAKVINGRAYKQTELLSDGKYKVLRVGNLFTNNKWYYSNLELNKDKYCENNDLLYAWSASFGARLWKGDKTIYHYHIWKIVPDESKMDKKFLYYLLNLKTEELKKTGGRGMTMMHLTKDNFEKQLIYLPNLSTQKTIVENLNKLENIINSNIDLTKFYSEKISERINKIWSD